MNEYSHIIEKVNIEVDVADLATAHRIRDNMADFLNRSVFPKLEEMFDGVSEPGRSYRIDKLSLDLAFGSEREFEEQLPAGVLSGIAKLLHRPVEQVNQAAKEMPRQQFTDRSGPERHWEVFIYFLRTGTLPWFAATDSSWLNDAELLQLLSEMATDWRQSFYEAISNDSATVRRLLLQFTPSFIARLASAYAGIDVAAFLSEGQLAGVDDQETIVRQRAFLRAVLEMLTKDRTPGLTVAGLRDILERVIQAEQAVIDGAGVSKESLASEVKDRHHNDEVISAEGIYVYHAGLVLLHPFLQYFFKEFDLLDGKQFISVAASHTAAHLLYYLATGNEQPMEYNMIMEKYLCGVYIHEPIDRFTPLTVKMKEESLHLLKAAIGHWKSLKNTSPDGLREAFLTRNGKLVTEHGRDNLVVEHKSIDVLLDQLPWSVSIVALPWLEKEIYVDWNASIR